MSELERCPLCSGPNQCGRAAGQARCWCFEALVPAEVLARVPEADQARRCVCASCAAARPATAPDPAAAWPRQGSPFDIALPHIVTGARAMRVPGSTRSANHCRAIPTGPSRTSS